MGLENVRPFLMFSADDLNAGELTYICFFNSCSHWHSKSTGKGS